MKFKIPKLQTISRYYFIIVGLLCFSISLFAQENKTRFVAGLAGPELLHVGLTYRLANSSQIGLSAGAGPSMGQTWTSLSLENRLYLGKDSEKTKQIYLSIVYSILT